jgi:hypothetical protein
MGRTVTAELYVHATPDAVAAVLPDRVLTDRVAVDAEGDWAEVAWTRSLVAWRRSATWRRGRRRGWVTIDLVTAERDWTLTTVTLHRGPWWSGRGPVWADAGAVARQVRTVAEDARPGSPRLPVDPPSPATAVDRPAALAVGYSRP